MLQAQPIRLRRTLPWPMSARHILLIQGHPDSGAHHFCHALEDAYADAAQAAGHLVQRITVGTLDFPLLRSEHAWQHGALPDALLRSQAALKWADHVVLFFPLWLGDMPALLKGYLEQVARPGFAFGAGEGEPLRQRALRGRSARVIVTMGMPAAMYRWYFRARGVRALERSVLGVIGFSPVRETLIGLVGRLSAVQAQHWLARMAELGSRGE